VRRKRPAKVFFLHVMKTGGTSVVSQMTSRFQPRQVYASSAAPDVGDLQRRFRVFGRRAYPQFVLVVREPPFGRRCYHQNGWVLAVT
jgi:hypothetical protein